MATPPAGLEWDAFQSIGDDCWTNYMRPDTILCADWSANPGKRSVYIAHVAQRVVCRIPANGWTVAGALSEAARWARSGSVLLSFDAPIGVPRTYLTSLQPSSPDSTRGFLQFLSWASTAPGFFDRAVSEPWCSDRPFFAIEPGAGSLSRKLTAMQALNVDHLRSIEKRTRGKSVFIKSGIPGSVGSAACDIWQALGRLIGADRHFRLWPFEGELADLLVPEIVVVGEMYPRAAYATALLDGDSTTRPSLSLAKTHSRVRDEAIEWLQQTDWIQQYGVTFEGLNEARSNDDDFDALMTAAALLRCALEGLPLHDRLTDAVAEGGILGTGSINLDLPEQQGLASAHYVRTRRGLYEQ